MPKTILQGNRRVPARYIMVPEEDYIDDDIPAYEDGVEELDGDFIPGRDFEGEIYKGGMVIAYGGRRGLRGKKSKKRKEPSK